MGCVLWRWNIWANKNIFRLQFSRMDKWNIHWREDLDQETINYFEENDLDGIFSMVAPLKRKKTDSKHTIPNSKCITSYMVGLLPISSDMSLLEPCGGEGVYSLNILAEEVTPLIRVLWKSTIHGYCTLCTGTFDIRSFSIPQGRFLVWQSFRKILGGLFGHPPYGAFIPGSTKFLNKRFPIFRKGHIGFFYKGLRSRNLRRII